MQVVIRGILLFFLCFTATATAGGLADYSGPIEAPAHCHFLSLKRNATTGAWATTYSPDLKTHISADVLCVGESVTVDSPIVTNGGDVIIYGDRVRIAQPIDTRVYINHSALDHFENEGCAPGL